MVGGTNNQDTGNQENQGNQGNGGAPPPPPPKRTLKDLTSPSFDQQKLCVNLEDSIKLKSQLIHWLPKFKGLPGDDPNRHLLLFQHRLTSLKPTGTDQGRALLTAFPFSLIDSAEEWFYGLPPGSITTWNEMQRAFLEKYFPASKAAIIRKAISGIEKITGETLYDYWERYKKLLESFLHHQISEQIIVQYFYDGLLQSKRNLIDAASGGALTNKTIDEATKLIENMTANTQQFNSRGVSMGRRVNEVTSSPHIEHRIGNIEKMIQKMAAVIIPSYEIEAEQVNAVFPNQQRQSYANTQAASPGTVFNRPSGFQQQPQPAQNSKSSEMLATMKNLTTMVQKNQQTTDGAIKELQTQMSTMAGILNLLETQNSGKLPSQLINPRETVNAVTLRSGTRTVQPEDAEKSKDPKGSVLEKEITDSSQTDEVPKTNSKPLVSTYVPPLPFSGRFANKNVEQDKEISDVLKKIHVNIPLIDAIRQVPKYARVLKDLCTKKKRLTGNEVMSVGENVSAILQKKLPPKCKDPGSFDIPVVIGNKRFGKSMLDLGASVNVMPASIYESLNLGSLKETRIVLELADRSNVYPRGIIEDVLVQVNQLVFPSDFVVLEMDSGSDASIPLLLGRPFTKTARNVIDVDKGTLTM
ncbi:uncharacterized protein LOC113306243 [Papaver somniferum]|uniref:uncharacterized protein LOC113306243 n=1 Tax=Papaver somniferum TaxID=3469 RepID=UPI000E6FF960|nr:uncharacterized protein LOC113306243 [Papaver somniferum]